MKIKEQLDDLRKLFRTKNIEDKTSIVQLTDNQMNAIISSIKVNKKDGTYEVDEDIVLVLEKGKATIIDNEIL